MNIVALCITLVLLTVGAVSGLTYETDSAPANLSTKQANDGVRRITPAQLRNALKDGKAILIDVRSERAYRAGHIKGAILIPVDEIGRRIDELPKDKLIATYCA